MRLIRNILIAFAVSVPLLFIGMTTANADHRDRYDYDRGRYLQYHRPYYYRYHQPQLYRYDYYRGRYYRPHWHYYRPYYHDGYGYHHDHRHGGNVRVGPLWFHWH